MNTPITKKAEREAKRAARLAEKQRKADELQEQLRQAQEAMTPPAELGSWGVVKTRCWACLHEKLRRSMRLKRPRIERLRQLNAAIREMGGWDAERCQNLLTNEGAV